MNKPNISISFILVIAICLLVTVQSVGAATRTVDNTTDNGSLSACTSAANDCSLRGAIDGAAAGDTINFLSSLFGAGNSINISSRLTINKNLAITGTGARNLSVNRNSSSGGNFPVFDIDSGTVRISGILVTNGTDGGIYNSGGTVTLDGMWIAGNLQPSTSAGGGITNRGTMTILNSLITGNNAVLSGAGISSIGTLTVVNTTITGNTVISSGFSASGGAGINMGGTVNLINATITDNVNHNRNSTTTGGVSSAGTVNIRNTIISGNLADSSANDDVLGVFNSNGNNLVTVTTGSEGFTQSTDITGRPASLGALQNNGGQTDTRVPIPTSLAINRGNNCVLISTCGVNNVPNPPGLLLTDQRGSGFPRQNSSFVDIGAAESPLMTPTAAGGSIGGRATEANGRGIFRVSVTMTDASGNQRVAYTNQQGYYNFEDVAGGQVYIFTAQHRRYSFDQPTQVQFIGEEQNSINFIGISNLFRFDIWNLPTKQPE